MIVETNNANNVIINKGGENFHSEEFIMDSVKLCEMINKFRLEEGNRAKLEHKNFLASIREEVETLNNLGFESELNFEVSTYKDSMNREKVCYKLNKWGIMQMLNKESTLVRYKTLEYIKELENKIEELRESRILRDVISRTKDTDRFILDKENRTVDIKSSKFKNLLKSIIAEGENIIPIIVRELPNGKYLIVDGHNRFVAILQAKQMGIDIDIRYIINNNYTLEKDIELQSIASRGNWKRLEKLERGIKLEVPLCSFIKELWGDFEGKLSNALVTKCVLRFLSNTDILHDNRFYSEDTFYKKLGTKKGMEQLLKMEVSVKDRRKTREFVEKFAEFYKGCGFEVSTEHVQAFATNYDYICLNFNELISKWNVVLNKKTEEDYCNIYYGMKNVDKETFGKLLVDIMKIKLALTMSK